MTETSKQVKKKAEGEERNGLLLLFGMQGRKDRYHAIIYLYYT